MKQLLFLFFILLNYLECKSQLYEFSNCDKFIYDTTFHASFCTYEVEVFVFHKQDTVFLVVTDSTQYLEPEKNVKYKSQYPQKGKTYFLCLRKICACVDKNGVLDIYECGYRWRPTDYKVVTGYAHTSPDIQFGKIVKRKKKSKNLLSLRYPKFF